MKTTLLFLVTLFLCLPASGQVQTTEKMLRDVLGANTSSGYDAQAVAAHAIVDVNRDVVINGKDGVARYRGKDGSTGIVATDGVQTLTSATTISVSLRNSTNLLKLTPAHTATLNSVVATGVAGRSYRLVVTTSGTDSFTLTFGTGFKTTGTLATGTVNAKVFVISFVFDGTNFNEVSRTTAM